MATKSEMVIKLDFSKMIEESSEKAAQNVAIFVRNFAKTLVRKDSKKLLGSIRTNKVGRGEFETIAGGPGVPYALAQEYGFPDIPNYGFTPYMRPAAVVSEKSPEAREEIMKAVRDAIRESKIVKVVRLD